MRLLTDDSQPNSRRLVCDSGRRGFKPLHSPHFFRPRSIEHSEKGAAPQSALPVGQASLVLSESFLKQDFGSLWAIGVRVPPASQGLFWPVWWPSLTAYADKMTAPLDVWSAEKLRSLCSFNALNRIAGDHSVGNERISTARRALMGFWQKKKRRRITGACVMNLWGCRLYYVGSAGSGGGLPRGMRSIVLRSADRSKCP